MQKEKDVLSSIDSRFNGSSMMRNMGKVVKTRAAVRQSCDAAKVREAFDMSLQPMRNGK